jgi:hypothetical protein
MGLWYTVAVVTMAFIVSFFWLEENRDVDLD